MSVYLPVELRRQLEAADEGQCVYRLTGYSLMTAIYVPS